MSINRGMDKEDVVYIHNGIFSSVQLGHSASCLCDHGPIASPLWALLRPFSALEPPRSGSYPSFSSVGVGGGSDKGLAAGVGAKMRRFDHLLAL